MFQKLISKTRSFEKGVVLKNAGFFQLETNEKGWCKPFTPYCELYVLND